MVNSVSLRKFDEWSMELVFRAEWFTVSVSHVRSITVGLSMEGAGRCRAYSTSVSRLDGKESVRQNSKESSNK